MNLEFTNFFLAFIEGFALILSPCILPILPIMLSGTMAGGKKRPLGIILGFALTFALFTLFSRFLVQHAGLNLNIIRDIAFALIILFGIILLSDRLSEKFSQSTQKLANLGANITAGQQPHGFFSGLLFGGLVSLIWTPCAGPILAAALIQIALQKTLLNSFIALFMFSLGSVIPMIIIAFAGKKLIDKLGFLKSHSSLLRKIFGVIIIVVTLALAYVSYFRPDFFALLSAPKTSVMQENKQDNIHSENLINALTPYPAPALAGLSHWLNSPALTLSQLKGKVVLIDFWTYSCINCIRTLPYLLAWDKAYRSKGLIIIGVHTPEFEFEKNSENVRQAVLRFGIQYPVALDNDYMTWQNFQNHYWPAHYLIDKNGRVVYQQFGEGDYVTTEHNIRVLLGLNKSASASSFTSAESLINYPQTPETYLGYARADHFASPESVTKDSVGDYTFPAQLATDEWALQGKWLIAAEKISNQGPQAAIKIHFNASHVYVVMGSANHQPLTVEVLLNGKPITPLISGSDVKDGLLLVNQQRLYELANFPHATDGEITLIIRAVGGEIYTFTFG